MTNENKMELIPTRKYYDMINKLESDLSEKLKSLSGQTIVININDKGFIDYPVTLVFGKMVNNSVMTYTDCPESLEWVTVKFDNRDDLDYNDMSELFSSYIQLALTIVDEVINLNNK